MFGPATLIQRLRTLEVGRIPQLGLMHDPFLCRHRFFPLLSRTKQRPQFHISIRPREVDDAVPRVFGLLARRADDAMHTAV